MSASSTARLILVVPCYNEAERLPHFLPRLVEALADVDCRIQVVDDGSQSSQVEATEILVDELRSRFAVRLAPLLALPVNQGKGAAIRAGWQTHSGSEWLAFVDADGAIAPLEVRRVIEIALSSPKQAYFASRVKMLGRKVDRSLFRHLIGRVFATAASLRLNVPVYDTQCGLKIVPGTLFEDGCAPFKENGFGFDLELMVALLGKGFSVQEVPIDWTHIPGSKIHLVRDSIRIYAALDGIARRRHQWTSPNRIK